MRFGILLIVFFSLAACVRHKKTLYLLPHSDAKYEKFQLDTVSEYKIQAADVLAVNIISTVATSTDLIENRFNSSGNNTTDQLKGYLIDSQGFIELPLVGKIKVQGLTCNQASDTIQKNLNQYLQYVTVSVKVGFKFNVLGEIGRPGQIQAITSRVHIYEALALAGDITEFGDRQHVKILRKKGNEVELFVVDVSKKDLITSNLYYLQNNDTIIIDRRKAKTDRANITNVSFGLSLVTLFFSLLITTRNIR